MKTKKQYAKDLLNFLNSAPTAFQATDALSAMLDLGRGRGPIHHGFALTGHFAEYNNQDLPERNKIK